MEISNRCKVTSYSARSRYRVPNRLLSGGRPYELSKWTFQHEKKASERLPPMKRLGTSGSKRDCGSAAAQENRAKYLRIYTKVWKNMNGHFLLQFCVYLEFSSLFSFFIILQSRVCKDRKLRNTLLFNIQWVHTGTSSRTLMVQTQPPTSLRPNICAAPLNV